MLYALKTFLNLRQQSLAGIFEDVDDVLKALCTAVVGVGHVVGGDVGAELRHAVYLLFGFEAGSQFVKAADVAVVHAEDEVELFEVAQAHWAREMSDVVSSARGMGSHARVGLFALMVADESCRVHLDGFIQSFTLQYRAHHLLGSARSADVAQAHKEYLLGVNRAS